MRFDQGWVKAYRIPHDHWLTSDGVAWAVLMTLVLWANYEDSPSNAQIQLKRGQVLTSSYELAKYFKLGRQRIRRVLDALAKRCVINLQPNPLGTLITICNYDKFQKNSEEATYLSTNDQPTSNLLTTYSQPINKEVKNSLQEKKERIKENIHTTPDVVVQKENIANLFIIHYCELYKLKYHTNPIINGKAAGIAKRVVKDLGIEKAKMLLGKYLEMNDQFFVLRSHDLPTFELNLNKIAVFEKTGQRINHQMAERIDVEQANAKMFEVFAERLKQRRSL